MRTFRLLDTPPMSAAENMALDDVLLELRGRGRSPDTLRFLQFAPACVLVGYHQSVREEIRLEYCRAAGIDINRRITGGGAIYFDRSQLGWEVICGKAFFDVTIPDARLYRTLCRPVVSALKGLGVAAAFRPRNDIEVGGRKISGTGGTESEEAFLFQGTLLVDFDADTMLKVLRIPVEKLKAKEIDSVKERVTCLRWELGAPPPLPDIKAALCRGFESHLGIRLAPAGLTAEEQALWRARLPHYLSNAWIDPVRKVPDLSATLHAASRTTAGLVRFTLELDQRRRLVKQALITGDFLSYPARALYDLEAELRGVRLDRLVIQEIVQRFFDQQRLRIPGIGFREFVKPLEQIFRKADIAARGIPLSRCDRIHLANAGFDEIRKKRPSVLLLPYCAKPVGCDLRHRKSCRLCGREDCSIGAAWRLGRRHRLRVTTITSFEDLQAELARMKAQGVPAFVGCCCQPFTIKHADDFRRAGIPAILLDIDNTTCYELDQAREARAGAYDRQTNLDLGLLESVFDALWGA